MRLHSSLPRPSEIRLPAKVRQIDTGCGTALSHPVEAVNDRLQTETQPEGPPPDNRAQVNGLGLQSHGQARSRHVETKRRRGVEVDRQLELGQMHDRQVDWFRALENAAGIDTDLTPRILNVASVLHVP